MKNNKTVRQVTIITLVIFGSAFFSCSKCYECDRSTASSSGTTKACFDTAKEAKKWSKEMENNGYDCTIADDN